MQQYKCLASWVEGQKDSSQDPNQGLSQGSSQGPNQGSKDPNQENQKTFTYVQRVDEENGPKSCIVKNFYQKNFSNFNKILWKVSKFAEKFLFLAWTGQQCNRSISFENSPPKNFDDPPMDGMNLKLRPIGACARSDPGSRSDLGVSDPTRPWDFGTRGSGPQTKFPKFSEDFAAVRGGAGAIWGGAGAIWGDAGAIWGGAKIWTKIFYFFFFLFFLS